MGGGLYEDVCDLLGAVEGGAACAAAAGAGVGVLEDGGLDGDGDRCGVGSGGVAASTIWARRSG